MAYQNKVAIVTGGASGIGKAVCQALAREGARVIVADINEAGAKATAQAINENVHGNGGKAEARILDVTRADDLERLIADVAEKYGSLDYMFNNAGLAVSGDARDLSRADWQLVIDVNLMGVIHGSIAAYRIMAQQGSGHIVNTASASGIFPAPILTAYSTTKFGVVGFSEGLRAEGESLGIKVTALCPGFIESKIFDSAHSVGVTPNELRSLIPFRFLDPDYSARRILKGVARNRALIIFPAYVHAMLWMYRLMPGLAAWFNRRLVRSFRRLRKVGYRSGTEQPSE